MRSMKGKAELLKLGNKTPPGSSLDELLKRTEEELKNLNLTQGLNLTQSSDPNHSFDVTFSDIDEISVSSYSAP